MTVIYFVQRHSDDAIKIGYSEFIKNRLMQLKSNYGDLVVLGVMRGHQKREGEIHKMFSADCIRGEWFNPSREIIDFITANTISYVPPEDDRKRQNIYLEPQILAELKRLAKREHRTAPAQASHIIARYLKRENGLPLCAICREPVDRRVLCAKCEGDK